MRIHPSVRQWVLSFLVADAAFLVLLLANCAFRPVDCLETFTFAPYLFYLPVVLLIDWLPNVAQPLASMPFWGTVAVLFLLGALSHALLGAAIGWLLRGRKVAPIISFVVAVAVVVLMTLGFSAQQAREEAARETATSLWAIERVSKSMISYHDATIVGADSPSTFELIVDEGTTTWNLENTGRTEVWLICNVASCEDEAVDGKVWMTFDEYVAVHNACAADPTTCPYYSIGVLDLFEVVHDPNGIVRMVEVYTP